MGKQSRLHLVQRVEPSAALVQVHSLVPFAPFLQPFVDEAPQVIQVSFNKMTVVVLPAPHQWIEQISDYVYTTRSGM